MCLPSCIKNLFSNKKIRLAVVGSTSSGKSYLLSDIIHTFEFLSFQSEPLPLDYPYRSFEQYFSEYGDGGIMPGTSTYACRQENVYGATLKKEGSNVDVEFLNIPGEIFNDPQAINAYQEISKSIKRYKGFKVSYWRNEANEVKKLILPDISSFNQDKMLVEAREWVPRSMDPMEYLDWTAIFGRLFQRGFQEFKTERKVSGEKIWKNLDEYDIDSFIQTVMVIGSNDPAFCNTFHRFQNAQGYLHFYFYRYCSLATDIVICDKLFSPVHDVKENEKKGAENFTSMMDQILGLIKYNVKKPHVYMALRGADVMMDENKMNTVINSFSSKNTFHSLLKNNVIYTYFADAVCKQLDVRYKESLVATKCAEWLKTYGLDVENSKDDFNFDPTDFMMPTGLNFNEHLRSRAQNQAKFMNLLKYVGKNIAKLDSWNFPLLPHVYFTATPIDANFRIYKNEPGMASRFLREGDGRLVYFHIIGSYWNFGTAQLCSDILRQNDINMPIAMYGPLLSNFVMIKD